MSSKERKIDHLLSVIVICLYAVIIAVKWIMVYRDVPDGALRAVDIIRTVVLCLIFIVVLYNACCWTDSLVLKLVFLAIALFLIASAISMQIPEVATFFYEHKIPMIL